MSKPRVISPCVAERYTRRPDERIIEFMFDNGGVHKGGLISFRNMADGSFKIEVYRCDPGIRIVTPNTDRLIPESPESKVNGSPLGEG